MKQFFQSFFVSVFIFYSFQVNAQYTCIVTEFAELQTYNSDDLKAEYCKFGKNIISNTSTIKTILQEFTDSTSKSRSQYELMEKRIDTYEKASHICREQRTRLLRILKSKEVDANLIQCEAR